MIQVYTESGSVTAVELDGVAQEFQVVEKPAVTEEQPAQTEAANEAGEQSEASAEAQAEETQAQE